MANRCSAMETPATTASAGPVSVIEVTGLAKTYPRLDRPALAAVSFSISPGEVVGLVGQNGAGKTTLLKLILGFLRPTTGHVRIWGNKDGDSRHHAIGFVPEKPSYHSLFTAREYLDCLGRMAGMDAAVRRRRITEVLTLVRLGERAGDRVGSFSKGMLQRLGVAQAILTDPELVIMDEPASGLDPLGQKEIRDLIVHLQQAGKTILFSSHHLSEVEKVCSRLLILHRGRLIINRRLGDIVGQARSRTVLRVRGWNQPAEQVLREQLGPSLGLEVDVEKDNPTVAVLRVEIPDDEAHFRLLAALVEAKVRIESLEPEVDPLESFFLEAISRADKAYGEVERQA